MALVGRYFHESTTEPFSGETARPALWSHAAKNEVDLTDVNSLLINHVSI